MHAYCLHSIWLAAFSGGGIAGFPAFPTDYPPIQVIVIRRMISFSLRSYISIIGKWYS